MNGKERILRVFYPASAGRVRNGVSEALNVLTHTAKRVAPRQQRGGEKDQQKKCNEAVHYPGPDRQKNSAAAAAPFL